MIMNFGAQVYFNFAWLYKQQAFYINPYSAYVHAMAKSTIQHIE